MDSDRRGRGRRGTSTAGPGIGGHFRRTFFVLIVAVAGLSGSSRADDAPDPSAAADSPAFVGCGKAEALARRFRAEPVEIFAPGLREAAAETDVLHYRLDIEISNLSSATNTCQITGSNTIFLRSNSPALSQFTFRLRDQYAITAVTSDPPKALNAFTLSTTTRRLEISPPFGPDEEFSITIQYSGPSASRGFGSIDVGTQGGQTVVATLSEPYYAYTWWPVKDADVGEPGDMSDKSTMELFLTVPNNYVVPSNGLLSGVDFLSGNRRRYRWSTQYPIATYLISFAATNYNTWTRNYQHPGGSMPVEFFIYPGSDTAGNRAAWEKCVDMLGVFRPVFGEYPFINEKYGMYQFNFGGGMEHQTITGQGTFAESVTAHELGHQWWGDMITCRTWSDIWLNEGFATYSECVWEERKTGTINPAAYFSAVLARKPTVSNTSVYVYPAEIVSGGINRIFNSNLSYRKGCWVLHMLRRVVGDATFFNLLAAYRAAFAFSAATTDDFAAVASQVSGRDLSGYFNQWVYQGGQPAYQFGWQGASVNGRNYLLARIAQTQASPAPNVFVMPVDLRATIGGFGHTLTVPNDAREEWFVVPVSGGPSAAAFDPDQWILRTVTNVAYQPGPAKIVETDPPPGSVAASGPTQISVWFQTNVNAPPAEFSLVGVQSGPRPVSMISAGNPIVLDTGGPLPPDAYLLTVGTGVTAADSGMALDGEMVDPNSAASLPSGDGVPGGAAMIRFAVVPVPGDLNVDGVIDETDLELFVQVLLGLNTNPLHVAASDLDGNQVVNGADVRAFLDSYLAL